MKTILSRFSMKRIDTLFYDKVNGRAVNLYEDKYGERFMAQSIFGMRLKH